jgi:hypothetical protein
MLFSAHRLSFCATRFTSPPDTIHARQSAVVQNGIADTYIASTENKNFDADGFGGHTIMAQSEVRIYLSTQGPTVYSLIYPPYLVLQGRSPTISH